MPLFRKHPEKTGDDSTSELAPSAGVVDAPQSAISQWLVALL
jgi:hypothetical protein